MSDERGRGHAPVMLEEVIAFLQPRGAMTVVDATVGLGGHAAGIASAIGARGRLIAIDQDPASLEAAKRLSFPCRVDWVHGNFGDLGAHLERLGIDAVDGVVADLGVSSPQLDVAERGFSFRQEGPLDMRMDPTRGEPAARLIAQRSPGDLARIFWEYGEERHSRRVARRISDVRRERPIRTTLELADIVRSVVPASRQRGGPVIDPATRVFQALRIAVNDELGALESLLDQLPRVVKPGGRAVVISFHSLEDRPVKQAFRERSIWRPLTKRPARPTEAETDRNPRSRSAKLRAAERIGLEVGAPHGPQGGLA